tara:strand:+ start:245 stop:511 length:267 start_codon:yes stop_codon:yes gene_type:complete
MLKELKSFFYLIFIFFFLFLSIKYYFSDEYKKKSYRNFSNLDEDLILYGNKLKILDNDTNNIIQYIDNSDKKIKKKFYHFWDLLKKND